LVAGKVFTHNCDTGINFCIDSVLKIFAANRKRRLSALPNVGPYVYDVKISGFTRISLSLSIYIYIYTHTHTHDIRRLRVNIALNVSQVPEIRTERGANEIFALLGCYASFMGSYLPTFRDNLPAGTF
jgi:hypothetical protein